MPDCTIRKLRKEDNAILANIIRRTFEEFKVNTAGTVYEDPTTDDLYHLFYRDDAVCWVAEIDGAVAGCAGIYPTKGLPAGYCEFAKFYLAPSARGKGVGGQLMHTCIASAKELGYTHIYLESLPAFSKAIGLYTRAGFRQLKEPLGNSGHFGCNIWMIKEV
ncbi:GNAT family N-acetyltransferase [Ilyomonas limi]|jgi:putative acetyltransferase|uniref:GNAT family N-acetyltransferase n=1 Tax=Ilyomonas limi TaxID=2575867 RepID=A0A4U3KWA9_9BACT|nr:GNAT family N-acetyltransferase [Ilyomonas limi]TKK66700.1 GNAT family N-acetyltransferase [Ilyomonas limi]